MRVIFIGAFVLLVLFIYAMIYNNRKNRELIESMRRDREKFHDDSERWHREWHQETEKKHEELMKNHDELIRFIAGKAGKIPRRRRA